MVGIIPREESKASEGPKGWLYLAVFLLILCAAFYFLMNYLVGSATKEIVALKSTFNSLMSPEKISLEKEISNYKNKIENFSFLVEQHVQTSAVFKVIERTAHPQVWFTEFNFNPGQNELKITGETESFENLGQQIIILKEDEQVNETKLNKITITKEGKVEFELSIFFDTSLFKAKA